MAIALAEADKYEILDKIGKFNFLSCSCYFVCLHETNCIYLYRLRFIRNHSQSQAQDRWIRKCGPLVSRNP